MFHLACCQLTEDRAAVDNSIPAEQSIYCHGVTLTFRQNRTNYTEIKLTLIVQHSLCPVLQKGEPDPATGAGLQYINSNCASPKPEVA